MIIIGFFYRRFSTSATKRQSCITFFAAIAWILPLIIVISIADPLIAVKTGQSTSLTCAWPADTGAEIGKMLVYSLSYTANCSAWPQGCKKHKRKFDSLVANDGSVNIVFLD